MKNTERFFAILLLITSLFLYGYGPCYAQTPPVPDFILLEPADSLVGNYPVLKIKPTQDTLSKMLYELARSSSMALANRLYFRIQAFLTNTGKQIKPEPAYLLLSQHQGGYARDGFYLLQGDTLVDKRHVSFVDLVKNKPNPEDHLGSITQVYPHEMGHVYFHLLSAESDSIVPAATDLHYCTMITDYPTAFNEGFGIHFENIARQYEPDTGRLKRILADFNRKKEFTQHRINPFVRDFTWPMRIGLYRASMILWYEQYEDIKRFEWVNENRMKYLNESVLLSDPEKSLQLRNTGIGTTNQLKNLQQMLSSEGMVASFFMMVINSDLKNFPVDSSLLSLFSYPDNSDPDLQRIENQYIKIFYVMHRYVNRSISRNSQLLDFVTGYCSEFPNEADEMKRIFREWSGADFPVDPGPALWITNKEHQHGVLLLDQFGGITLPFYTFNLNAATEADLMTFHEFDRKQASQLISHIAIHDGLKSYEELRQLEGLDTHAIEVLLENRFDPGFFKNFEEEQAGLSLKNLLNAIAWHLVKWFVIWFVLLIIIVALTYRFLFHEPFRLINGLMFFLRFLVLYLLALAVIVTANRPLIWFLSISLAILFLHYMILRKKKQALAVISGTAIAISLLCYSLL